jgi:hypothetical protein
VVSIVARTQFADWRDLRLKATDSPEYRSAVNKLALRIVKIEQEVTSALIAQEARLPADEPGVSETVDAIQKLLPAWQESVMGDPVNSLTKLSQTISKSHGTMLQTDALVAQGNEIVGRWWNAGIGLLVAGPEYVPLEWGDDGWWHRVRADDGGDTVGQSDPG